MSGLPGRRSLEETLARLLGRQFQRDQRRVLEALGDPPRFENITPELWDSLNADARGVIQPVLEEAFRQQIAASIGEVGVSIDWTLVNERAARWAREYTFELVRGIDQTSQRALREQVAGFFEDQRTLGDLRASIGQLYGPVRAEMIATTEVTRAASQGERGYADELRKLGLEVVHVWQTSMDEIADECPICGPLQGRREGDGWTEPPPAHPRCRCWISTEVIERVR